MRLLLLAIVHSCCLWPALTVESVDAVSKRGSIAAGAYIQHSVAKRPRISPPERARSSNSTRYSKYLASRRSV